MQTRILTEQFLLKISKKKRILVTGLTGFEGTKIFKSADYCDLFNVTYLDDRNRYCLEEEVDKHFSTFLAAHGNIYVGKIDEPSEANNYFDEIFFIVASLPTHHAFIHELKDGWVYPNMSPVLREVYSKWTFKTVDEYKEVIGEEFLDYTRGVVKPKKLVHTSLY